VWVLDSSLEQLESEFPVAKAFLKMLRDSIPELVTIGVYVACFCENDNLLSQWRAYGESGGYALGILRTLRPEGDDVISELVKVEYDKAEQQRKVRGFLRPLLELLDEPTMNALWPPRVRITQESVYVLRSVIDLLFGQIASFKNAAFADEREWRIVLRPSALDHPRRMHVARSPINFRVSKGILVPYLKLIPETGNLLPLTKVRFGPLLQAERTKQSVGTFLREHKHLAVQVEASEIPIY
jgi:hypothetical protein